MSARRVIICADDYGISPAVSGAIRDLVARRRINATSAMVASPHFTHAEAAKLHEAADGHAAVGLHVTLTGPFKPQSWALPPSIKEEINKDWEAQFTKLFHLLGAKGTRQYVEKFVTPVVIQPSIKDYLGEAGGIESVSDLAD